MSAPPAGLVIPSEVRMQEHLRALRSRTAAAFGLKSPEPAAAQLFSDLLEQPDDTSSVDWLMRERPGASAALALQLAVRLAEELQSSRHPPRQLVDLFGEIVGPSDSRSVISNVSADGQGDPAAAIQALREFRRVSNLSVEKSPLLSLSDPGPLALLADLLRLEQGVDELEWLQRERQELSARLALRTVVESRIPSLDAGEYGRVLRTIGVNVRSTTNTGLDAAVKGITLLERGFSVRVRARIHPPARDSLESPLATWEGFDRVTDAFGRRYVAQVVSQSLTKDLRPGSTGWREDLVLFCAPAVQAPHVLTFESRSAALAQYRQSPRTGELIAVSSPQLGSLECRVTLSA